MINIGALIGQISMVFAERFVGFWLAFTLPTIMFMIAPLVLWGCRKKYYRRPPTGSVLSKALHLIWFGIKQRKNNSSKGSGFFDRIKPSKLEHKPQWMNFDDAWVDEVRRGLQACRVFLWFPIYWLTYSQILNNLISQAATLERNGVPNEIVSNIDPLTLIIFIPVFDQIVYPGLSRMGIRFTPIKRIFAGFMCGSLAMVVAALIQHFIYVKSRKCCPFLPC
jgi:proton-dependent oligopeptide transporter, POT family